MGASRAPLPEGRLHRRSPSNRAERESQKLPPFARRAAPEGAGNPDSSGEPPRGLLQPPAKPAPQAPEPFGVALLARSRAKSGSSSAGSAAPRGRPPRAGADRRPDDP